jgi:CheY-like chemotaxis protein
VDSGKRLRLLLVDDDRLVREVLAEELEDFGYCTVQAEDGRAALAVLAAGEKVHMLISDLSMPGMDGVELIAAAQARHPFMPAILMTGFAGEAACRWIGDDPARSVTLLRKPVSGPDLADRVTTLLSAARVPSAASH